MSGAISTISKAFNSVPGRIATGLATGGLSEVGRQASGVALRSGAPKPLAQGIGLATASGGPLGLSKAANVQGAPNTAIDTTAVSTGAVTNPQDPAIAAPTDSLEATRRAADDAEQLRQAGLPENVRKRAGRAAESLGLTGRKRPSASAYLAGVSP